MTDILSDFLTDWDDWDRSGVGKLQWSLLGPEETAKANTPRGLRYRAWQLLGEECQLAWEQAERLLGAPGNHPSMLLGPLYAGFPASHGAWAVVGGTIVAAMVQAQAVGGKSPLEAALEPYIAAADPAREHGLDPGVWQQVARRAARTIGLRLLIHEADAIPDLWPVEVYRQHRAGLLAGGYHTLFEILEAAIVLPDLVVQREVEGLEVAMGLLDAVRTASLPFQARLAARPAAARGGRPGPGSSPEALGAEWTRVLVSQTLVPHLPLADDDRPTSRTAGWQHGAFRWGAGPLSDRRGRLPPLGMPPTPGVLTAPGFGALLGIRTAADGDKALAELMRAIEGACTAATGQAAWEDIRPDRAALQERCQPFGASSVRGNPTEGHRVSVHLGGGVVVQDMPVFERVLAGTVDDAAAVRLEAEARPITEVLRRLIRPGFTATDEELRHQASGTLDPAMLPVARTAGAPYRRVRTRVERDRTGRPVLLIAADGSSSNGVAQIRLAKLMTVGFLLALRGTRIRVLAGTFTSDAVRTGVSGEVITWLANSEAGASGGPVDAARRVSLMRDQGAGGQSDVLAVQRMLDVAREQGKGAMVYLCWITDGMFNRCFAQRDFPTGLSEVRALLATQRHADPNLHVSIIAVGRSAAVGVEDVAHQVLRVPPEELADIEAVAGRVARYVSASIVELGTRTKREVTR